MSQLKMLMISLATASTLALFSAGVSAQDQDPSVADNTSDLSTYVKTRLLWNHSTSGLNIDVTSQDGVVILEGTTDSAELRELAERLAADTNGVRGVDNRLQVQPDIRLDTTEELAAGVPGGFELDALGDAWLTGKIKSLLLMTRGLASSGIAVTTRDGQVHLSGEVESAAAKQDTEDRVRNVRGVREVNTGALKIDS